MLDWLFDFFDSDSDAEYESIFEEGFSDGWESCLNEVGNELLELDDFL